MGVGKVKIEEGVSDQAWFPLENQDDYRGRITFRSYYEDYSNLWEAGTTIFERSTSSSTPTTTAPLSAAEAAALAGKRQVQEARHIGNRKRHQNVTETDHQTISLFLPSSIQIADKIDYSQPELGLRGALAFMGTRGAAMGATVTGSDVQNAAVNAVKGTLNQLFSGNLGSTASSLATQRLAQKFSMPDVAGGVAAATGVAVNPNKRNILNGVALRTFRFTFKLIARSERESNEIKKIIYMFRSRMYPRLTDDSKVISPEVGGLTSTANDILNFEGMSAGLNYPAKWDIEMSYYTQADITARNERWVRVGTEILPCFLESFEAVYNPNSMSFHSDGSPSEVDISINYVEERAMNANDIESPPGYNKGWGMMDTGRFREEYQNLTREDTRFSGVR